MSVLVEVLFVRNAAGGHVGEVRSYPENSLLLKAILLGGHAVPVNPPDWSLEKKEKADGEGDNKFLVRKAVDKQPGSVGLPKPESSGNPAVNAESGSERYGRPVEVVFPTKGDNKRESGSSDRIERPTN